MSQDGPGLGSQVITTQQIMLTTGSNSMTDAVQREKDTDMVDLPQCKRCVLYAQSTMFLIVHHGSQPSLSNGEFFAMVPVPTKSRLARFIFI